MKGGSRFLVPFLVSLVAWYGLYELVVKPAEFYDRVVIDSISSQAESMLRFLGYDAKAFDTNDSGYNNYVEIYGASGVTIGPGCDGLVIIALFVIFVLFFPGPWKHKIWYLSVGVLLVHVLNILRVTALAIIMRFHPEWLEFNHDYTFTILTYGFVFLLWFVWVDKFSTRS